MPRNLPAAYIAACESQSIRPAHFVEANFTSGPIYVWSGLGTVVWGGKTWLGLGSLAAISTIEEGSSIEAKGILLSLSAIDITLLTGVLQEFQVGLPVFVYLGLFDASGALLDTPAIAWAGRMDQPVIEADGQTFSISIACENRLVEMNVAVDRRYTNEQQQRDYPGDLGMSFVNAIANIQIYWGRSPSSSTNM